MKNTVINKETVIINLIMSSGKSAWEKGVTAYAVELLNTIEDNDMPMKVPEMFRDFQEILLDGSEDWYHYSHEKRSIVSNEEIATRLTPPSKLKRGNYTNPPNSWESWLDVQARALGQACVKLYEAMHYKNMD